MNTENEYTQKVKKFCDSRAVSPFVLFKLAHFWRFNRDVSIGSDVHLYRTEGVVPKYVQVYLDNLDNL